jgi:hypothetical protein
MTLELQPKVQAEMEILCTPEPDCMHWSSEKSHSSVRNRKSSSRPIAPNYADSTIMVPNPQHSQTKKIKLIDDQHYYLFLYYMLIMSLNTKENSLISLTN